MIVSRYILELEGAQRVHISAKWIFYSFYTALGGSGAR